MFRLKLIKDKNSERINLIVFKNYKKFDQLAKIYKLSSTKTKVIILNSLKFKKYVAKGLNFYNKKCLLLNNFFKIFPLLFLYEIA